MQPSRHIPLEGASNFRDFGGYATRDGRSVKWRRLFRSDHLAALTAADYDALNAHHIQHVFDLRRDAEAEAMPTRWLGAPAPRLIRSSLVIEAQAGAVFQQFAASDAEACDAAAAARALITGYYVRLLDEPGPLAAFQRLFDQLAEPQAFPILIHCAGGKDRTGVTSALIQMTLGVGRADIVADFMLTRQHYDWEAALEMRVAQMAPDEGLRQRSSEALAPFYGVEEAYIDVVLGQVEDMGGIEAFLTKKVGIGPHVIETLREALID